MCVYIGILYMHADVNAHAGPLCCLTYRKMSSTKMSKIYILGFCFIDKRKEKISLYFHFAVFATTGFNITCTNVLQGDFHGNKAMLMKLNE